MHDFRELLATTGLALALALASASCGDSTTPAGDAGERDSGGASDSGSSGTVGLHMPCDRAMGNCMAGLTCCYAERPTDPTIVPICQAPGETCDPP